MSTLTSSFASSWTRTTRLSPNAGENGETTDNSLPLHHLVHAGLATVQAVHATLQDALDLPIRLHCECSLHRGALNFAARFNLPAAYDAHYLALADRLGVEYWTAGKRLFRVVQDALTWVRLAA